MKKELFATVSCGEIEIKFRATAHKSETQEDLRLHPIAFYDAYARKIPTGEHWEIEIMEPCVEELRNHKLHFVISLDAKTPFVCYPPQIPTVEKAEEIFKVWSLGSALKIIHGIDFNPIYSRECNNDMGQFLKTLEERYGIRIS